jgi:hypothetical protein
LRWQPGPCSCRAAGTGPRSGPQAEGQTRYSSRSLR